jgi:uncharacterized protein
MLPVVADNLPAIEALCREYGVVRLDLFGSAATGEFDPSRSDIDFLVEYAPDADLGPWLSRFFDLRDRLAALLGYPVDLVMAGAPRNPWVIRSIEESRRLLYAA